MIKIYGHSDDCFEVEGEFRGENEYSCYNKPVTILIHDFTFDTDVIVTGEYAPDNRAAAWRIAIEPVDEDKPMPAMTIQMAENGYSPLLIIDCSENTVVDVVKRGDE
jgi:hypothetical protein